MVEFAMVFILLFTVVSLVIQGGFFFSGWLAVTNGAREGARFGAPCLEREVQACTVEQVEARAEERSSGFLDPVPGPVATVELDTVNRWVTVRVTGTVPPVGALPLNLPVYGESRMRLEMR